MFRASRDDGRTWGPIRPILEEEPIDGTLAVDAHSGAMYAAMSPTDGRALYVVRSLDGGATWSTSPIASRNSTSPADQQAGGIATFIFPVAAVDDAGTVYVAWAEDESQTDVPAAAKSAETPHVYLSVSRDHGATFSKPAMVSPPDKAAVMPAIAAGSAGRVALAWYEGELPIPPDAVPQAWWVTLTESTTADQARPAWKSARTTHDPVHIGAICTYGYACNLGDTGGPVTCPAYVGCIAPGERTSGDFFEVALRPNGQPILAYVSDPPAQEVPSTLTLGVVAVSRVTDGVPMREAGG
jgi:hypothetical protein